MTDFSKPLLLAGDLYIGDASTDGTFAELDGPFETDKLAVQPSANTVEMTSKAIATYGQVISSVVLPGVTNVSISFMDIPAEILALMFMGTFAALTQSGSTATDESVTAAHDRWVPLAKKKITAGSVVVTTDPAGTTYTEGTDYEIEYNTGMLKALSTGSISDAQALLVDYAYGTIAGDTVTLATSSQQIKGLKLVGVNLHDNTPCELLLYRVKLRPTGEMDLKAGEHVKADLSGIAETPTGMSSPGSFSYLG